MPDFSICGAKFYLFSVKINKIFKFLECLRKLFKIPKPKPANRAARIFRAAQTLKNAGVSRLI